MGKNKNTNLYPLPQPTYTTPHYPIPHCPHLNPVPHSYTLQYALHIYIKHIQNKKKKRNEQQIVEKKKKRKEEKEGKNLKNKNTRTKKRRTQKKIISL